MYIVIMYYLLDILRVYNIGFYEGEEGLTVVHVPITGRVMSNKNKIKNNVQIGKVK